MEGDVRVFTPLGPSQPDHREAMPCILPPRQASDFPVVPSGLRVLIPSHISGLGASPSLMR